MDVFDYLGACDPDGIHDVCVNYGYNMNGMSRSDAGECARQLVQEQGEPAFKDLMENHPEKNVLLELFQPKDPPKRYDPQSRVNTILQYHNATGSGLIQAKPIVSTTSVLIFAGAVLITIALFVHTNNN